MATSGVVERAVTALLDRHPMPGLAVGVIDPEAGPVVHTFGSADVERDIKLDERSVFRISSMSKIPTTVALMRLREQGLIELDRPVNGYLRTLRVVPPRFGQPSITVAQLLTHTSGISSAGSRRAAKYRGQARPPSLADVYGGVLVARDEPGRGYAYSNHNFAVLGQIIEDVTGEPFERHVTDQVLKPLGMRDTSYAAGSREVVGYGREPGGHLSPTVAQATPLIAACEARSSIADLMRLATMLLPGPSNTILTGESRRMMLSARYQLHPGLSGAGLCFGVGRIAEEPIAYVNAYSSTYSGVMRLLPERRAGVVLLANLSALHALDLLADVLLRLTQKLAPAEAQLPDVPVDLHRSHWPEFEGRYAEAKAHGPPPSRHSETDLVVREENRSLYLTFSQPGAGQQNIRLAFASRSDPTAFQVPPGGFDLGLGQLPCAIAFLRDGNGAVDRLCIHSFLTFRRIRPTDWRSRIAHRIGEAYRRVLDQTIAFLWPFAVKIGGRVLDASGTGSDQVRLHPAGRRHE